MRNLTTSKNAGNFTTICLVTLALALNSFTGYAQKKATAGYTREQADKVAEYRLVILSTANTDAPMDSLIGWQTAHIATLFSLKQEGKIAVFGPSTDNTVAGIIIFNTNDNDEVRMLLKDDPYIKNNVLKYQILQWFGLPGQALGTPTKRVKRVVKKGT